MSFGHLKRHVIFELWLHPYFTFNKPKYSHISILFLLQESPKMYMPSPILNHNLNKLNDSIQESSHLRNADCIFIFNI